MAKLEWVRLQETYGSEDRPRHSTYRARVPGGWLVSTWMATSALFSGNPENHFNGGGVTFVPDPNHEWQVEAHKEQ